MRAWDIFGLDLADRISGLWGAGVLAVVRVALSIPIVSFGIAVVVLVPVVAWAARRSLPAVREDAGARYRLERQVLATGAAGVIVVFVVESFLRGYVWDMSNAVSWWWQALPLFTASVAIAALAAVIAIRRAAPAVPFLAAQRRTALTFGPRILLPLGAAALGLLVATTIGAGAASSSDDQGRYVYLDVPLADPTEEPLRFWFYGWSYGIPVLICSLLLVSASWMALRANAVRPSVVPRPSMPRG
ncbi:hypothetical protein [Microbacterium sp. SA156]|uniref:hypothetical protein n=1 Tax=unclassified Microbacterium TaxID=2609290 RepID=UPI003B9F2505